MKVIAVGRNYAAHAAELENAVPDWPVIFMKPETALLKDGQSFYYPDFSHDIQHEAEIVLRISQHGKAIEQKYAYKYYDSLTLGIDFTARDLQQQLKDQRISWELAKSFDGSAPIGQWLSLSKINDLQNIDFCLFKNEETVQEGNTAWMLFSFDYLIHFVSRYFTLKAGDLLFTGTPVGVGSVYKGDQLTGYIEQTPVLKCVIR